MSPTISKPNESECAWISSQLTDACRFIEAFVDSDQPTERITPSKLDRAFEKWISESEDAADINETINMMGIAFGDILQKRLALAWVVATDEFGCELALAGDPVMGGILIYPITFVAKRWERREVHFFEDSVRAIERDVISICLQNVN